MTTNAPDISGDFLRDFMEQAIPFNRFLGVRVAGMGKGFARLELPFRPEFIGDPIRPALHGGVLTSLIDTCGGLAVFTEAQPGDRVSTIDLRVDFLRPGKGELLAAEARVVRVGNRVAVVDITAFHAALPQEPVATGKGVYNLKRMPLEGGF
ncbi:MAG: hotdog fold thioesterase [Deltaproteobacteria bacterium]